MQVTMRVNRHGGALGLLAAGQTYDVDDALAFELVGAGYAVYVTAPVRPDFRPDRQVVGGGVADAANTVVLLGDSMTGQNNRSYFGTGQILALSRTNNVATLQINAHGLWTGRRIRIRGETVEGFNGDYQVTRVDANTVTFPCPGPDATAARTNTMVMDRSWRSTAGYFFWLQKRLGGRLNLISNEGINAQDTAQILARVPEVIALNPKRCIVLGGYNDLIRGFTPAQTLDNLTQIAQQLSAAGIACDMLTPLPIGSGASTFNSANVQHLLTVKRGLLALAASNTVPGLIVHDVHDALVDRNNTTNVGAALPSVLADNIHPSWRGAQIIGHVLADNLSAIIPPINRLPSSYADVTLSGLGGFNVVKAGPYTTSGGTTTAPVTGVTAQHLTTQRASGTTGSAVASVVTAADGSLRQRLVITPGGAETWTVRTNDGAAVLQLLTAGERRRLVAYLRITGIAAGAPFLDFNVNFNFTVDGVTYYHYVTLNASGDYINRDVDGVIVSDPVEMPPGTITNCGWRLDVRTTGAGSDITVEIGRVGYLLES